MPVAPRSPFPPSLAYDDDLEWWSGTTELPAFAPIRIDVGDRRSTTSTVELLVTAGADGPTAAQAEAYAYCIENQDRVRDVVLTVIADSAREDRKLFEQWHSPAELEELLPAGVTPAQLKTRVRLTRLQIGKRERDGFGYVEYHFNAAWDREHGLQVVLHKDRLVYSGGSGDGWRDRGPAAG